jgi:serine/threonine protein kinase/class 3 adenylate cyclase
MSMTTLRNRYVLEREIGRGATGSVWISRDQQLSRRVAVKLLCKELLNDPAAHARFEREARTIAQLRSSYIVQVYDVGVEEDQPFIVMELLEGESLEARLARHPHLPLTVAGRVIADMARGMLVMHKAGIVHRDLKPANVFLAREQERELAKLLDFGVSTPVSAPGAPSWPVVYGTPLYMSPEQRFGGSPDDMGDLWSLSVMAYQMLTGHCPFESDDIGQLDAMLGDGTFKPPSEWVQSLDTRVDAFFRRALAKLPAQRFASVAEFAAEFLTLSRDEERRKVVLLYIDDEPDMKLLLERRFKRQLGSGEYELRFALSAEIGLEQLRHKSDIDVVLTDIKMPGMDGLTFLSTVPQVNPLVRVVMVSAYSDITNIRAAMNRGAFDFVCKPIDFDDLERTIDKCAADVSALRGALRSHEENHLLRTLVGCGAVDRHLASLRATGALGYQQYEATVAFLDVGRFSEVVRSREPAQVFGHLNAHFELFAAELLARGGSVNRFIGDCLLAIFDGPGHLERATEACITIIRRVKSLDQGSIGDLVASPSVTIGLDTGWLIAGGVGSIDIGRLEHMVLGAAVSTAARLQVAAPHQTLLVSARLAERLQTHYECMSYGLLRLDARSEPVPVFQVLGLKPTDASQRPNL